MAHTRTVSVSSSSSAATSSSNGTGSSSPSNTAAQSSSSAAGSSSTIAAAPTAITTTTPATATPVSTASSRITRRAARNACSGFPTQPPATGLDRTVRLHMNFNINRVLRQRQLLDNRRGIPPKLSHFTKLLGKNLTHLLFRFANKYRPETRTDNKLRRRAKKAAKDAEAAAAAGNATDENVSAAKKKRKKNKGKAKAVDPVAVAVAAYDEAANKTPYFLKYGMNHIAELTEKQRAQLVVISDDTEPPEALIWLPALCCKNNVPYAIVIGSARLGTLVNKRSTTAVAFTEIREEEQLEFSRLVDAINAYYAKVTRQPVRGAWMGGLLGFKARVKVALRATVAANRLQQQQQQGQQQQRETPDG